MIKFRLCLIQLPVTDLQHLTYFIFIFKAETDLGIWVSHRKDPYFILTALVLFRHVVLLERRLNLVLSKYRTRLNLLIPTRVTGMLEKIRISHETKQQNKKNEWGDNLLNTICSLHSTAP